jgi:type IV pilus assembly protein PilQ
MEIRKKQLGKRLFLWSLLKNRWKEVEFIIRKYIALGISLILISGLVGNDLISGQERKPELITNVFFETDIREVLRDISAQSGVTIIPDNTVQGVVSLALENAPLEKALEMVLMGGGYTFKKIDDYYLVGAAVHDNPTFSRLTETKYIKPNYIKAKDIPKFLPDFFTDFIHVNEDVNTLTVIASREIIARIEEDIAKIDIPRKQVMIQALVTDFSKGVTKELGIDWEWQWNTAKGVDSTASGTEGMTDLLGTFTYATTGELTRSVIVKLKALIKDGKVKLRANPRIVTLDGQEATIFIGREEYYSIVSGPVAYPYTTLEAITAGITLKITPYISETGEITVEIQPEVSDVTVEATEERLPIITKRHVNTKVRVKDGETVVIGGLTNKTEFERVTRIPILGYIPIVSLLFKAKKKITEETEIVVFITPSIMPEGLPKKEE